MLKILYTAQSITRDWKLSYLEEIFPAKKNYEKWVKPWLTINSILYSEKNLKLFSTVHYFFSNAFFPYFF